MGVQHQHHQGELPEPGKSSVKWSIISRFNISHHIVVGSRCDQAEEGQIWSDFYNKMSSESQEFDISQIKNTEIKLQLISLQDKGSGALSADKAHHVRPVVSRNVLFLLFQFPSDYVSMLYLLVL